MTRYLLPVLFLLTVSGLAFAVATREPLIPFDRLAYIGEPPDSIALDTEGDNVWCMFSFRDGTRYRWPADAPWVGMASGERLASGEEVPGDQYCVRMTFHTEPIT